MPIITLTTDFGLQDHYVAAMKGAILKTAPKVTLVDVTHEIAPHNVLQGALVLDQVWNYYPPKTVHVAVVDPGVGTSRRILAGQYDGQIVLGSTSFGLVGPAEISKMCRCPGFIAVVMYIRSGDVLSLK